MNLLGTERLYQERSNVLLVFETAADSIAKLGCHEFWENSFPRDDGELWLGRSVQKINNTKEVCDQTLGFPIEFGVLGIRYTVRSGAAFNF